MVPAAGSPDLAGSWRLVEQNYGEGSNNLIRHLPGTLRLQISHGPEGWSAFIRSDAGGPQDLVWPAFVNEQGVRQVLLVDRQIEDHHLFALYEVVISPEESMHMRIREDYRIEEAGELVGVVDVRLVRDGRDEGGFVLYRRFERES
jgi:hypothetical protein